MATSSRLVGRCRDTLSRLRDRLKVLIRQVLLWTQSAGHCEGRNLLVLFSEAKAHYLRQVKKSYNETRLREFLSQTYANAYRLILHCQSCEEEANTSSTSSAVTNYR